jgi:hypothetical protein
MTMGANCFVGLQTDTVVAKDLLVPDVCREEWPSSPQDAIQLMSVKVEEVPDVQEEEFHVPVTWQAIKAEQEVGSASV